MEQFVPDELKSKFEVWLHIMADGKIHAPPMGSQAQFNEHVRFVDGQGPLWQKATVPVECYLSWGLGRSDSLQVPGQGGWAGKQRGHVLESLEACPVGGLKPQKVLLERPH